MKDFILITGKRYPLCPLWYCLPHSHPFLLLSFLYKKRNKNANYWLENMNFSFTSCNSPESWRAWKVMKWDFFQEQMNEGRWLSEPKAWWNEGIVKGLSLGWGEGRDALGSGGIRRDGWRLITHLCFSSQHRGSHCWECDMVWDALWGWVSLSVSVQGCCGSFGVVCLWCVLFVCGFFSPECSLPLLLLVWSILSALRLRVLLLSNVLACLAEPFVEGPCLLVAPSLLGSCNLLPHHTGAFWDLCCF